MASSATLCQLFVAQDLKTCRTQLSQVYIIHYMDDILLAMSSKSNLLMLFEKVKRDLLFWPLIITLQVQMG